MARNDSLFFARVWDPHLLEVIGFYAEDIAALTALSDQPPALEHRLCTALRHPPGATFAWWWGSALPLVVQARLLRRPIVVTGAINETVRSTLKGKARARLKRALLVTAMRLATTNIVVSDYEETTARRLGGRRIERLYPGVETEFFRPGPKASSPTAITAGQLYPIGIRRKGIDVSIEAAALVRKSVPDFRLLVIGPVFPDGEAAINKLRETLDFSGVDMLGEVSRVEKQRLFASSWAYLQPSVMEGFGLAMAEAMATGTVPICSDKGALPEVVGAAGIVLGECTPKAVADALVRLIRDDTERDRLGAAARSQSLKFDSHARTARLEQILRTAGWPLKHTAQ